MMVSLSRVAGALFQELPLRPGSLYGRVVLYGSSSEARHDGQMALAHLADLKRGIKFLG